MVNMDFNSSFLDYKSRFNARPYDASKVNNPSELVQIDYLTLEEDGVNFSLNISEDMDWTKPSDATKYLWLIMDQEVRVIEENIQPIPKHTNLSGGENAYCGGEVWFTTPNHIYFNGGSGRYTPRSKEELENIETALQYFGYDVVSFGWDDDLERPARSLRYVY